MDETSTNDGLDDDELEGQLYAMVHHENTTETLQYTNVEVSVPDSTQTNAGHKRPETKRYWRCDDNNSTINTQFKKVNSVSKLVSNTNSLEQTPLAGDIVPEPELKQEKNDPMATGDIEKILEAPVSCDAISSIEILSPSKEHTELSSSDEDEVVEVALPPKAPICIESSDEDEVQIIVPIKTFQVADSKVFVETSRTVLKESQDRSVSSSPVPSVVSSVSDDFIRTDCANLNISSKHLEANSFDFSLHGSDLLGNSDTGHRTPETKKKKKQKNKVTASLKQQELKKLSNLPPNQRPEGCFATPKNKAKRKKKKESNRFTVTESSLPSADVYESDSNQSSIIDNQGEEKSENGVKASKLDKPDQSVSETIDLTDTLRISSVYENHDSSLIIANVEGIVNHDEDSEDHTPMTFNMNIPPVGSKKVPPILESGLNFDFLFGSNNKSHEAIQKFLSSATPKEAMHKFYNESWGGEDFNHREIQKNMSRDRSLWKIDPKDRMPTPVKRRLMCQVCNRPGHRDDRCRLKTAICHMCGDQGHYETRCPNKICMNCGSSNYLFSSGCRACATWARLQCAVCGCVGHPAHACPDLWRRYHSTIDNNVPLVQNYGQKKHFELYCSGCTRRGHLVHTCRVCMPFSNLPIHSPYVYDYRPVYPPTEPRNTTGDSRGQPHTSGSFATDNQVQNNESNSLRPGQKRSSTGQKHPTHENKRKSFSKDDEVPQSPQHMSKGVSQEILQPIQSSNKNVAATQISDIKIHEKSLCNSTSSQEVHLGNKQGTDDESSTSVKKGDVIQDSEVSNSSEVITVDKIFIMKDVLDKLKSELGTSWLAVTSQKYHLDVTLEEAFIAVKGTTGDQESFHVALRNWAKGPENKPQNDALQSIDKGFNYCADIAKKKNALLKRLSQQLNSLKIDLGDPKALFNEWQYLNKNHDDLLKKKIVNPVKLANSRQRIDRITKKLNMILLGQAGLADGSKHLNGLYSLKDSLSNYKSSILPDSLRYEIGLHYHSIFTPKSRNDYPELINLYYKVWQNVKKYKKNQNHTEEANIQGPFIMVSNPIEHNKSQPIKDRQKEAMQVLQKAKKTLQKKSDAIPDTVLASCKRQVKLWLFRLMRRHSVSPKDMKKITKLSLEVKTIACGQ